MSIFNRNTIYEGILAGVLISLFLGTLSVAGDYGGEVIKYFKFLFLFAIVAYALYRVKRVTEGSEFLVASISKGFGISVIGGFIVTVVNFVLFLINPDFSIQKYTLIPTTPGQVHLVNLLLMIEFVIAGLLSAFIMFQGLKYRNIE